MTYEQGSGHQNFIDYKSLPKNNGQYGNKNTNSEEYGNMGGVIRNRNETGDVTGEMSNQHLNEFKSGLRSSTSEPTRLSLRELPRNKIFANVLSECNSNLKIVNRHSSKAEPTVLRVPIPGVPQALPPGMLQACLPEAMQPLSRPSSSSSNMKRKANNVKMIKESKNAVDLSSFASLTSLPSLSEVTFRLGDETIDFADDFAGGVGKGDWETHSGISL